MIKIKLTNIKIHNEFDNKQIYKPIKIKNTYKYQIIFELNSENTFDTHEQEHVHVQFILYANFINSINIISKTKLISYKIIPNQGIFISNMLDKSNSLVLDIEPIDLCTKITIKNFYQCFYPITNSIDFSSNLVNPSWSNIFIINLARRVDRKEQMKQKLSQANLTTYEFIEAFDGLDEHVQTQFKDLKLNSNCPIITTGHFACLLSHIKAIRLAESRKYPNIMILEDDVFFSENFLSKLSNLKIPKYSMLYLGGITSKKKLFFNNWANVNIPISDTMKKDKNANPNSIVNTKIMGAYAYILDKSIYKSILGELEKYLEYVDIFFMKKIQPNYPVILLGDFVTTDLSSSDTSHKSKKLIKRLDYIVN